MIVRDLELGPPGDKQTTSVFSSRCVEPTSSGGWDLPRRAADEEV